MNIQLGELQVIEDRAITKRLSGIIGEDVGAAESYTLTAVPNENGVYSPITITPVSFDYYGGVVIKGSGVSEYLVNDANMFVGKSLVLSGPMPKNVSGTVFIQPLYAAEDYATVTDAVQGEGGTWELTLGNKTYLYSSIYGTPVTGKLNVIGRSFSLDLGGRLAQIIIDQIYKDGDDPAEMTSNQYNTRVAEEMQRKIDFFFGPGYATATYNTAAQRYEISMAVAGPIELKVVTVTREDLSYFGFVAPTYNVGSEELNNPGLVFLTGSLADMDPVDAIIAPPNKIVVTFATEPLPVKEELVGQKVMLVSSRPISYDVMIYR